MVCILRSFSSKFSRSLSRDLARFLSISLLHTHKHPFFSNILTYTRTLANVVKNWFAMMVRVSCSGMFSGGASRFVMCNWVQKDISVCSGEVYYRPRSVAGEWRTVFCKWGKLCFIACLLCWSYISDLLVVRCSKLGGNYTIVGLRLIVSTGNYLFGGDAFPRPATRSCEQVHRNYWRKRRA